MPEYTEHEKRVLKERLGELGEENTWARVYEFCEDLGMSRRRELSGLCGRDRVINFILTIGHEQDERKRIKDALYTIAHDPQPINEEVTRLRGLIQRLPIPEHIRRECFCDPFGEPDPGCEVCQAWERKEYLCESDCPACKFLAMLAEGGILKTEQADG